MTAKIYHKGGWMIVKLSIIYVFVTLLCQSWKKMNKLFNFLAGNVNFFNFEILVGKLIFARELSSGQFWRVKYYVCDGICD